MVIPNALKGIPDLEQTYYAIDRQMDKLNGSIAQMDEDVFFDNMSEERVKRWESMLDMTPSADDTIEERRFAIHSRVVDKLPYSYRIIMSDLLALAPDATMDIDYSGPHLDVRIALSSQSMIDAVQELLERKLPLNMTYEIIIVYNTWGEYESDTWGDVSTMTWQQMKENE
jgi:hypothetical protein